MGSSRGVLTAISPLPAVSDMAPITSSITTDAVMLSGVNASAGYTVMLSVKYISTGGSVFTDVEHEVSAAIALRHEIR
jgi:hypothetical protein